MKYKRRIGNGLAFQPEKDMELFRKMAKEGYHLCGFSKIFSYKFEKGEPKDYIFSYTAINNPDDDYIAYFTDAGWEPVMCYPNFQIFRALPGTEPVYTDTETLVDFYREELGRYSKYSIGTTIFFIISCYLALNFFNNTLSFILYIIGLIPFVFTVLPLLGFFYYYRKYTSQLK
ncbi:DUF2812 domain-containing protein [Irregularibacter muris]|uniref:DUF2812 domain-containing protein n=1 Tax=Irregularibacter muris TaxID=1796619 RepID=A0AAE3HG10_9FIRM|nr:DUF2812 domain-containing protein [Irregularibacter muris]MCR1897908.1 DUF2812 domain-containing protein [Irregularibacter muris]